MNRPRGLDGRFLPATCPECGDDLVEGESIYGRKVVHCTGLVDPEDDAKPLAPCPYEIKIGSNRDG